MSVPVDAIPKWIMLGFEKPGNRGVMVYASRTFPTIPKWGMKQIYNHDAIWMLEAGLTQMLRVDAADWNTALAQIFARWATEDAQAAEQQKRIEAARSAARKELGR